MLFTFKCLVLSPHKILVPFVSPQLSAEPSDSFLLVLPKLFSFLNCFPDGESFLSFQFPIPMLFGVCPFSLRNTPLCVNLISGSLSPVISTHSLRNYWLIRGICLGAVSVLTVYAVALRGGNGGTIHPFLCLFVCLSVVQLKAAYKVKNTGKFTDGVDFCTDSFQSTFCCITISAIASSVTRERFSINTSWGTVPEPNANLRQLLMLNNIIKGPLSLPATPPPSLPVKELWKDQELVYSQQELKILQLVVPPVPCEIPAKTTSSPSPQITPLIKRRA